MNDQNISWNERIQACCAHLLILFLFAASAVIMYFRPFAEPLFHSRGKFLPLDLLIEWAVNLTIKWDDGFPLIFFINFLLLWVWSKKVETLFVKEHLQQAFNFAQICLFVSIIGRYSFLSNITPARISELLGLASDPIITDAGFYFGILLKIWPYLIWYGMAFDAAIKSLRGKNYTSFVKIEFQLPIKTSNNFAP